MNKPLSAADLKRLQTDVPVVLTSAEVIELCLATMQGHMNDKFNVIHDIEGLVERGEMRSVPVAGTMFEPLVQAIRDAGVAIDDNLGGFQDATHASNEDMHDL